MNQNNKIYTLLLFFTVQFNCIYSQITSDDCGDWIPSECNDNFLAFVEYTLENGECKQWKDDCDLDRSIYRVGNVSIGTAETSLFSLTVKDGVVTSNVKICENAGSWCDYVFDEDYQLLTLEEVEKSIKQKGHLHKTPSAAEIEAEGSIDIGKVALDHQEKIEEAFLHIIAMKKKADALQEKLKSLQEENKALKKKG